MKKDIEISWNRLTYSEIDGGSCELTIYVKEFELMVCYSNIWSNWDFSILSHANWDLPEERNDEIDFDYSEMNVMVEFKGIEYDMDDSITKMAMALVGRPHEYQEQMQNKIF